MIVLLTIHLLFLFTSRIFTYVCLLICTVVSMAFFIYLAPLQVSCMYYLPDQQHLRLRIISMWSISISCSLLIASHIFVVAQVIFFNCTFAYRLIATHSPFVVIRTTKNLYVHRYIYYLSLHRWFTWIYTYSVYNFP